MTRLTTMVVLLLCGSAGLALANDLPKMTDASDLTWSVLSTSGPYWGAILVAYLGLQTFLKRQHWLAQGRLLSTLTAAGMVLTAVAQWHFSGAPVSGIPTALFVAVTLVLHPIIPPKAVVSSILVVLLVGAIPTSQIACSSSAKSRASAGVVAALDCERDELRPLVAELLPLAIRYVQSLISPDGRAIDTSALKAAWSTVKSDQGRCALVTAMATIAQPASTPGAPAAAGLVVEPAMLWRALDEIKAEHGWGLTKTSAGTR